MDRASLFPHPSVMAILYLVSTPIGNLGDLSPRAGGVLGSVSRVLAEDTRRTRTLLAHLGLNTPMVSLHAHNEAAREAKILRWLGEGEDLALVSDAGTPLVSDPGNRLLGAVLDQGHRVVPIPGPSAVLAALVASGLPTDRFSFLGFPPRKGKERQALLTRLSMAEETMVLFESPERLGSLLEALVEAGGRDRKCAVARELTKLHEEFLRGTVGELAEHFRGNPPRGEITLVLGAASSGPGTREVDQEAGAALARVLLERGSRPSQAAREVARRLGISRNQAYELVQGLSEGRAPDGE